MNQEKQNIVEEQALIMRAFLLEQMAVIF